MVATQMITIVILILQKIHNEYSHAITGPNSEVQFEEDAISVSVRDGMELQSGWTITVLASPKVGYNFEASTVYYSLFDITKSLRSKNEKWMPTFQEGEFLTASFWWSFQEMNISDSNTEYTYKEPEVQTTSS